jgi:hypothetical protein
MKDRRQTVPQLLEYYMRSADHMSNKEMKKAILNIILARTAEIGSFRVLIISFIFPEYRQILGDLAELSKIVEAEPDDFETTKRKELSKRLP